MINGETLEIVLNRLTTNNGYDINQDAMREVAIQCDRNQVAIQQIVDYLSAGDAEIAKKISEGLNE